MIMAHTTPPLTDAERDVIIDKGTERPGTGELTDESRAGLYRCRQCHAPLYESSSKFDSGCGWPAFDDAIPGAIGMHTDANSIRTEITCKQCDGHLGHIFVGERKTERNTRHCVNSISMTFHPNETYDKTYQTATLGGGCFWCLDAIFQQLDGVIEVRSGYMGGHKTYPRYESVIRGDTGHAEVVQVFFDPEIVSYCEILMTFFSKHDPTTLNQQGADRGTQYRSVIFVYSDEQRAIAHEFIRDLDASETRKDPIVTEVSDAQQFWLAE
jgi:peptide methionine sulfoxide reductase msrA/msrB